MRLLIIVLLTFSYGSVCAQDADTVFLKSSKPTTRELAMRYRVVNRVPENGVFAVRHFDMQGRVEFEGSSRLRDTMVYEGLGTYYEPGVGKRSEGMYLNGEEEGVWKHYYPQSGVLKNEVNYQAGKRNGAVKSFYADGKLKRNHVYAADSIVSGECYAPDGILQDCVYGNLQSAFPGDVREFIASNMRYPKEAWKKSITGRVVVRFVVDENGNLGDVSIAKSVHPALDEEAMRVIRLMPRWKPAIIDGEPVKSYFSLPIKFSID